MLKKIMTSIFLFSVTPMVAFAQSTPEELRAQDQAKISAIVTYVKQNLMSKTLSFSAQNMILDQGRLSADFSSNYMPSSIVRTDKGLILEATAVIQQKNYAMVDGVRGELVKEVNRVVVVSYQFGLVESTGELLGYRSVKSNTIVDSTGNVAFAKISLNDDNSLVINEDTIGYSDLFSADGRLGFTPGGSVNKLVYKYNEAGKMTLENIYKTFDYNVETGERTFRLNADGEVNVQINLFTEK